MNTSLYKKCLENIRFYKNNDPYIGDIIKVKIIKYQASYIECFSEEYNKIITLDYKNATNIKKLKNIKKYFTSIENLYLIVTDLSNGLIEVSHQSLDDDDVKLFEKFLKIYKVIRVSYIKYFIIHMDKIDFNDVVNFLNETLWKLELDSKNIVFHLDKFYKTTSYFTDLIDYQWCKEMKDDIDNQLKKCITRSKQKVNFIFTINSLDLNAIKAIQDTILQFNTQFKCELQFLTTPEYFITYEVNDDENFNSLIQDKLSEFSNFIPNNKFTQLKFKSHHI